MCIIYQIYHISGYHYNENMPNSKNSRPSFCYSLSCVIPKAGDLQFPFNPEQQDKATSSLYSRNTFLKTSALRKKAFAM